MLLRLTAIALLTSFLCAAQSLDQAIKTKIGGFKGTVTIYAKNLDTGQSYNLNGDQPVRTASTIKLPIMIECFAEFADGKLKPTEPLTVTAAEKISGSGILQDLSDGIQLPLRDMILLMITLSDNTATNLILNRIGGNAVNARMDSLGLKSTRVMRKILGSKTTPSGVTGEGAKPANQKWGTGRSSPQEMVLLLEKLYRGQLVSKQASAEMLDILKKQRDHNGIGRDLKDTVIANKSGALDLLRSDVGIVFTTKGAIAIAITVDDIPATDWTPDNPALLLIASLSNLLISGL
jgi:beta-lactamase class A